MVVGKTTASSKPENSIDVRQFFSLLWHWVWLILIITLLTGLTTYIVSKQLPPIFRATTTILVNEAPSTKASDYTSLLTNERLTRTYSQMITKTPILMEVIQRLGLGLDANTLAESVFVSPVSDTQLIDISVESDDPITAALIANTMVSVFSEELLAMQAERYAVSKENIQSQLYELEQQIESTHNTISSTGDVAELDRYNAQLSQQQELYSTLLMSYEQIRLSEAETTSSVSQVQPALPPNFPVRPKVLTNTLIGTMLGMMLVIGVIFAFEALDDTLKSPDDVVDILGLPVLSVIYRHTTDDSKPITEAIPRSPVSEAFRTLRTNVQFASVDKPLHIILVTSPAPNEGKTSITTNLAIVLAQSGMKVTIIDADMRRPKVHEKLSIRNHLGLSSIFVRPDVILNGMVQKTRIPNLWAITSGRLPPNPSELLGSNKMKKILDTVKEKSDIIIIDTPPTLAVTDAAVLVSQVDGVLMVMRPGTTKLASATQSVEQLNHMGANIIGVVLNNIPIKRSRLGYYYYKGYQGYEQYYVQDDKK